MEHQNRDRYSEVALHGLEQVRRDFAPEGAADWNLVFYFAVCFQPK